MKIEIYAKLEFGFTLSQEQIRVLSLLSTIHYDGRCRMLTDLAQGTRKNGLLTIWKDQLEMQREADDEPPVMTASWRDLDTLLKCMEMAPCRLKGDDLTLVQELEKSFLGCLRHGDEVSKNWTASYPPVEAATQNTSA